MAFNTKHLIEPWLNLLYPPLCTHCHTRLLKRGVLFCSLCLEQISLIELKGRCRVCFGDLYKGRCERCMKRPVIVQRQLAACEAMGPAKTLLSAIQSGRRECIPAAASLMAYQWLELKIPMPDFLIPLPFSFWQKQQVGFDAHLMLAVELGKILSLPVQTVFKQKFDRTHFLTQGEFRSRVVLAGKIEPDQRLLLVAPLLDDGLLRQAGQELRAIFPTQINALCFAALLTG